MAFKVDFIIGDFWSMGCFKDKTDEEVCEMVNPILNKPMNPEYVAKMRKICKEVNENEEG